MYLYPLSKIAYDEEDSGPKNSIMLFVCSFGFNNPTTPDLCGDITATQSFLESAIDINLFAFY
jgi:hypothetical protein